MRGTRESYGLELVGHNDLAGSGDGMQIMRHGDALYFGHMGPSRVATSVLDVGDPRKPELVRQIPAAPGSHSHKVQTADDLLLVNEERFNGAQEFSAGMLVYDLRDALDPKPIGRFESGGLGVHRIVYTGGRYAYMSAIPDGFDDRIWVIVDLDDPTRPTEVGRWWWPGMWRAGGESPSWPSTKRYAAHHALIDGHLAYLGYGDAKMVVLDISDIELPRKLSDLSWSPGGETHTCLPLPGRNLVVATDEAVVNRCAEETKLVRVYDITDPAAPIETAYWVPESPDGQEAPQINDVLVDASNNIFVSDRIGGGLYVLAPDESLARAMEEDRS